MTFPKCRGKRQQGRGEERLYGKCGLNVGGNVAITIPLERKRFPVSTRATILPDNFTHSDQR